MKAGLNLIIEESLLQKIRVYAAKKKKAYQMWHIG